MNAPRLSPFDDNVQVLNEDENEAGYQARQEGAPSSISATGSWRAGWADADLDDLHANLEAASSELGIRGTARLPNPAAISSEMSIRLRRDADLWFQVMVLYRKVGWTAAQRPNPSPVFSHEARLQLLSRGNFHLPLDILAQSNRGRRLCAFSRYCLYRPCFTTVTIPTLRSTRRCLEAVGCVMFMRPTISLTVQYLPLFRSPIISRRFASAIALKTSVVVAALAMGLRSS
jgi:hypothetical protein